MAKIYSRNQRIITGVTNPASTYSRIISCVGGASAAVPEGYGFTAAVGQVCWLLGIKLWILADQPAIRLAGQFGMVTGETEPGSFEAIREWERLLPLWTRTGEVNEWVYHGGACEFCWELDMLFTGGARRFGFWFTLIGATEVAFEASFRISEG